MTQKPELKIEAGKFYRLRNGCKYECYRVYPAVVHGCYVPTLTGFTTAISHWPQGTKCNDPHIVSDEDIISEWIDAPEVDWSVIPPWFKWIAMDKNGKWFAFSEKPESSSKDEMFFNGSKTTSAMEIPKDYAPKFTGDWKDSLVCRLGVEK